MPDAQEPQQQPTLDWIGQLRQSYSQIKLGPGIVGKTTRATLGLIGAWVVVIFRLSTDVWMNAFLFAAGLAATAIYWAWVKATHQFAEKNPHVALLEGAELIEYQKWEAAVNGKTIPLTLPVANPDEPIRIEEER